MEIVTEGTGTVETGTVETGTVETGAGTETGTGTVETGAGAGTETGTVVDEFNLDGGKGEGDKGKGEKGAPKAFDYNDVGFDGEGKSINLEESFKDTGIDVANPVIKSDIEGLMADGFTSEQIQKLYSRMNTNTETPEQVRETLAKSLSVDEKRNYKQIGSMLGDALPEELKGVIPDMMKDPNTVKIVNAIYSHFNNKGENPNNISTNAKAQGKSMTFDDSLKAYNKYVDENTGTGVNLDRERLNRFKQALYERTDDKEKLESIIG